MSLKSSFSNSAIKISKLSQHIKDREGIYNQKFLDIFELVKRYAYVDMEKITANFLLKNFIAFIEGEYDISQDLFCPNNFVFYEKLLSLTKYSCNFIRRRVIIIYQIYSEFSNNYSDDKHIKFYNRKLIRAFKDIYRFVNFDVEFLLDLIRSKFTVSKSNIGFKIDLELAKDMEDISKIFEALAL